MAIRQVLENVVTTIEAITCDSVYHSTTKFSHVETLFAPEDLQSARGRTRKFICSPTGNTTWVGHMGQRSSPRELQTVVDVSILYAMSQDAWELLTVCSEDADRLAYQLQDPTHYDALTTTIRMRQAATWDLSEGDEEGSTLILRMPVAIRYRPEF